MRAFLCGMLAFYYLCTAIIPKQVQLDLNNIEDNYD